MNTHCGNKVESTVYIHVHVCHAWTKISKPLARQACKTIAYTCISWDSWNCHTYSNHSVWWMSDEVTSMFSIQTSFWPSQYKSHLIDSTGGKHFGIN